MRLSRSWRGGVLALGILASTAVPAQAQRGGVEHSPDRGPGDGEGPFERLIIRGATIIDGIPASRR